MSFNKKGILRFQDIIVIAVIFVGTIVVLTMGGQVTNSLAATGTCAVGHTWNSTASVCYNSTGAANVTANSLAQNVSVYGLQANNNFASNMPTLATVIVASIIIGTLMMVFGGGLGKR